jgi:hypothetical protein
MPRATTLLLALPLAALLACAGGRTSAQSLAPGGGMARCDGQRVLVVDNRTGGPVDVYVASTSNARATVLATVRPGRQRVPLAEPVTSAYAVQDGVRVSGGRGRRRGNEVLFTYACE